MAKPVSGFNYQDKERFFSAHKKTVLTKKMQLASLKDTAENNRSYSELHAHILYIEQEFKTLNAVLKKTKTADDVYWAYAYYCASLLEKFYEGYGKPSAVNTYKKAREDIEAHYLNINIKVKESFITAVKNALIDIFSSPLHVSKMMTAASISNLLRVHWVFTRLFLKGSISAIHNNHLLDKLDALWGGHTDVDAIFKTFDKPANIFLALSIALFGVRFLFNLILVIKHTFFPNEGESHLSRSERFTFEIKKRHADMANQLVWTLANLFSNYKETFGISDPVALGIMGAGLLFDMLTMLYKWNQGRKLFQKTMAVFEQEKSELEKNKLTAIDIEPYDARLSILKKQIKELEINWESDQSTLRLMGATTLVLMIGFGLAMTIPVVSMACYVVCIMAVAVYLSDAAYSNYKKQSLQLQHADADDDMAVLEKNYRDARNELMLTLVKYSAMPTLLIATYAICWPAGVALSLLIMGYKFFDAHQQHREKFKDDLVLPSYVQPQPSKAPEINQVLEDAEDDGLLFSRP